MRFLHHIITYVVPHVHVCISLSSSAERNSSRLLYLTTPFQTGFGIFQRINFVTMPNNDDKVPQVSRYALYQWVWFQGITMCSTGSVYGTQLILYLTSPQPSSFLLLCWLLTFSLFCHHHSCLHVSHHPLSLSLSLCLSLLPPSFAISSAPIIIAMSLYTLYYHNVFTFLSSLPCLSLC